MNLFGNTVFPIGSCGVVGDVGLRGSGVRHEASCAASRSPLKYVSRRASPEVSSCSWTRATETTASIWTPRLGHPAGRLVATVKFDLSKIDLHRSQMVAKVSFVILMRRARRGRFIRNYQASIALAILEVKRADGKMLPLLEKLWLAPRADFGFDTLLDPTSYL